MKKHMQIGFGMAATVILLLALVLTGCSSAPVTSAPANVPAVSAPLNSQEAVAAVKSDDGLNTGIKVHGSWTIEVTNPDGTVAEHREFENALTNQGAIFLAQVMGRAKSVGAWEIYIDNTSSGSNAFQYEPEPNVFSPTGASINEPFEIPQDTSEFNNLTVNVPLTGPNANKLVLSGTAIAGRDGSINQVRTSLSVLPPTNPPTSIILGGSYIFSGTTLASPVTLTTGQQVAVTVVISFS
jgi:hypothetical protein